MSIQIYRSRDMKGLSDAQYGLQYKEATYCITVHELHVIQTGYGFISYKSPLLGGIGGGGGNE